MGKALFIILLMASFSVSAPASTAPFLPLKPAWEYYTGAEDFYLLDLNQDGENEVYLVIYGDSTTYVNAYNASGDLLWNTWLKGMSVAACTGSLSERVHMVYLDDLNRNKDLDIYVSTKVRSEKVNLDLVSYVERELDPYFRYHRLKVRWETKELSGIATDITTADVVGSGEKELLVSTTNSVIYALDLVTGSIVSRYELDGRVYDVYPSDVDGDGKTELVAGTYQSVYYIDGGIAWMFPIYRPAKNVHALQKEGEKAPLVLASDGESLQAFTLTGEPSWKTFVGEISGIAAADLDNDSQAEIIVSSGKNIYAYTRNGTYKWGYPVNENIMSIKVLSDSKLVAGTSSRVYVFETDNRYIKNKTAYGLYLKANESYYNDNCIAAKKPAEEALKLFKEIGNIEGALACDIIVQQCDIDIEAKDLADGYYALAYDNYENKQFESARAYAGKALELYIEKNFYYEVTLADDLLMRIDEAEFNYKLSEADLLYADAQWLYVNNELKNASAVLQDARDLYLGINYSKGLEDCEALYVSIDNKERKILADELFELAKAKYANGEYEEAAPLFSQAYETYVALNLSGETEKAAPYKNMSECYVNANQYYSLAEEFYKKADYENATYYALEAKNVYESLSDYRKVLDAESLATEIGNKRREAELTGYATVAGAIGFVLLILAAVFSYLRKKREAG